MSGCFWDRCSNTERCRDVGTCVAGMQAGGANFGKSDDDLKQIVRSPLKVKDQLPHSEVQVSYDLARQDKDLTVATITRVFENGFKVLAHLQGEDAEAFIDAWNVRQSDERKANETLREALLKALAYCDSAFHSSMQYHDERPALYRPLDTIVSADEPASPSLSRPHQPGET